MLRSKRTVFFFPSEGGDLRSPTLAVSRKLISEETTSAVRWTIPFPKYTVKNTATQQWLRGKENGFAKKCSTCIVACVRNVSLSTTLTNSAGSYRIEKNDISIYRMYQSSDKSYKKHRYIDISDVSKSYRLYFWVVGIVLNSFPISISDTITGDHSKRYFCS